MPALNTSLLCLASWDKARPRMPQGANVTRMKEFNDAMGAAIGRAFGDWTRQATISAVSITGERATGGIIGGPMIENFLRNAAPRNFDPLTPAVVQGLAEQWGRFLSKFLIPGLPLYPGFAAFPGSIAPPTAGTPTPLRSVIAAGCPFICEGPLEQAFLSKLAANPPTGAREMLKGMAHGVDKALNQWLGETKITKLMGSGVVPTFTPYTPFGSVVGTAIMAPGGFV